MKVIISGIEVEGTPQEVLELINSSTVVYKPKKAKEKRTTARFNRTESLTNPVVQLKNELRETLNNMQIKNGTTGNTVYLEGIDEFLTALYRYKPSNTVMGRESYIIKLLATGEPYTLRRLAAAARTNLSKVKQAITRAVAADCVIQATNLKSWPLTGVPKNSSLIDQLTSSSKVKMLAIGTIEGARSARAKYENAHLRKSVKVEKPKVDRLLRKTLSTGSAPITKIIYPEDRKSTEQE